VHPETPDTAPAVSTSSVPDPPQNAPPDAQAEKGSFRLFTIRYYNAWDLFEGSHAIPIPLQENNAGLPEPVLEGFVQYDIIESNIVQIHLGQAADNHKLVIRRKLQNNHDLTARNLERQNMVVCDGLFVKNDSISGITGSFLVSHPPPPFAVPLRQKQ
jgi:hypothetical protein